MSLGSALCGCLAAAPCRAEGANVAGFGLMSCADAALVFDQRDYRLVFMTWTLGFATGVDNVRIVRDRQFRDLSSLNADLVVGSLWAISAQYPTALLLQGAERFFGEPAAARMAAPALTTPQPTDLMRYASAATRIRTAGVL